jgi:hypothetical protein
MSALELSALLADATQGGAYFVDARDRVALIEAANGLSFAVLPVDFTGCQGKAPALEAIAQALRFPDWFGDNWDALADCLDDLSWLPADGYLLLLEHCDAWREAEPEEFGVLLEILNETAQSWAQVGVPFWALTPLPATMLAEMAF